MARRRRDAPIRADSAPSPAYVVLRRTQTVSGDVAILVRLRGGRLIRLQVDRHQTTDDNIAALVEHVTAQWPDYPFRNIERGREHGDEL